MNQPSDPHELEALHQLVAELQERVQVLEEQAARMRSEISEETLLAISAACAAYLGKRATITQVHRGRGDAWAAQGRSGVQGSHAATRSSR